MWGQEQALRRGSLRLRSGQAGQALLQGVRPEAPPPGEADVPLGAKGKLQSKLVVPDDSCTRIWGDWQCLTTRRGAALAEVFTDGQFQPLARRPAVAWRRKRARVGLSAALETESPHRGDACRDVLPVCRIYGFPRGSGTLRQAGGLTACLFLLALPSRRVLSRRPPCTRPLKQPTRSPRLTGRRVSIPLRPGVSSARPVGCPRR